MKKLLLALTILNLGGMSAWSQTSTDTSPPGELTAGWGSWGPHLHDKLQAMTPEQRQQFLNTHPRYREWIHNAQQAHYNSLTPAQQQQFAKQHPQLTQRLANQAGAGAGKFDPNHPRVNEVNAREGNQENRIAQGEKSGALTPGENNRLQKGEARIQNQETWDMAHDNGHLTTAQQNRLNNAENHQSRRIYRYKHNNRTK